MVELVDIDVLVEGRPTLGRWVAADTSLTLRHLYRIDVAVGHEMAWQLEALIERARLNREADGA